MAVKGFWSLTLRAQIWKLVSAEVIFLKRVSVSKLHFNFLSNFSARRAGISYKSDQCTFNEIFFPSLAYISDLEGGRQLASRNRQFSPMSRAEAD